MTEYTRTAEPATGQDPPEELLAEYTAAGIKLVRLDPERKKPIDLEWPRRALPLEDIAAHVGGGGNVGWQMGEVSGWMCAVDPDCPEAELLAPRFLRDTLQQRKGNGRPSLYFYRSPGAGYEQFRDLNGEVMLDLKASNNGRGHQVAVEPSVHPEKGPYQFTGGFDPGRIEEIPKDELRRAVSRLAVATLIARHLPDRGRHDLALALTGYMLRNGESPATVHKILRAAWEVKDAPAEAFRDLESIVRDTAAKLANNEPVKGGRTLQDTIPEMPRRIARFLAWKGAEVDEGRKIYALTDLGNSERLVHRHGHDLRYCYPLGRWFVYDGKRWHADDSGEVRRRAKDTVRHIYPEAAAAQDEERRKAISRHAMRSESGSRIREMIDLARDEVPVTPDQLDADPWALNVLNGTINLRTGELREHDRSDLITKLAPVVYDPGAEAPKWQAFLEKILPSEALRKFVQRASGYALTGDVSEQVLFFLYGRGANGKTTLLNAILEISGDYGKQSPPDLLVAKQGAHPTELADLFGARFVPSVEVEDGRRLAESLVKQLTGGDKIKARYMRQDFWEFSPTHKIFLAANHKPIVRGTDHAIWRRIELIPFEVTIPNEEQDRRLPEKLRAELSGILAWAVRGCLDWQREGLGEPEEVRSATESYRAEMDVLAAFIEDRCVVDPKASVGATPLYNVYKEWCQETGEHHETQTRFGKRLGERGFESGRHSRTRLKIWRGIGLLDPRDPECAQ